MIKVAIVGCGGMGNHHARKLHDMDDVQVVGVCDIIEEKAAKLGQALGVPHCTDYHDLLDGADAFWVCTEPFNRLPIVTDASAAGVHLFSEKPIALDLETADRIVELVDESGITFMVGYVLRFTDPYRAVYDMYARGDLGELVNVWTRRYMPTDMRPRWFGDQGKSGGVALDFASHDFDLVRWFGGQPKRVFAQVDRVREGIRADEHCQGLITFGRGMGAVDVSWWAPARISTFGVVGTKAAVVADGSGKLRLKREGDDEETVLEVGASMDVDPEGNVGTAGAEKVQQLPGSAETIQEHFIRCLRQGQQPLVTAREGREVLRLVLAVQQSASSGRSVDYA